MDDRKYHLNSLSYTSIFRRCVLIRSMMLISVQIKLCTKS
ncbi:hypothetical protein mEp515_01 [Escherichia phage mEp515]